jgi:hypothetical protein
MSLPLEDAAEAAPEAAMLVVWVFVGSAAVTGALPASQHSPPSRRSVALLLECADSKLAAD